MQSANSLLAHAEPNPRSQKGTSGRERPAGACAPLPGLRCIYIYIYIYICICIYVYMYEYISLSLYICIYIYIYINTVYYYSFIIYSNINNIVVYSNIYWGPSFPRFGPLRCSKLGRPLLDRQPRRAPASAAGTALNTLAWNDKIGPRFYFVGF